MRIVGMKKLKTVLEDNLVEKGDKVEIELVNVEEGMIKTKKVFGLKAEPNTWEGDKEEEDMLELEEVE